MHWMFINPFYKHSHHYWYIIFYFISQKQDKRKSNNMKTQDYIIIVATKDVQIFVGINFCGLNFCWIWFSWGERLTKIKLMKRCKWLCQTKWEVHVGSRWTRKLTRGMLNSSQNEAWNRPHPLTARKCRIIV